VLWFLGFRERSLPNGPTHVAGGIGFISMSKSNSSGTSCTAGLSAPCKLGLSDFLKAFAKWLCSGATRHVFGSMFSGLPLSFGVPICLWSTTSGCYNQNSPPYLLPFPQASVLASDRQKSTSTIADKCKNCDRNFLKVQTELTM
jgi:hypothetical protein